MEAKDFLHFQNNHEEVADISSSVSLIQHGKTKKSYLHFQNNDKEFVLYIFLEATHSSVEQVSEDPN